MASSALRHPLANLLDQSGQSGPQERFAAGDANLVDRELLVQEGDQPEQFFVAGQRGRRTTLRPAGQDGNSGSAGCNGR